METRSKKRAKMSHGSTAPANPDSTDNDEGLEKDALLIIKRDYDLKGKDTTMDGWKCCLQS
jgi:hypothetical protein